MVLLVSYHYLTILSIVCLEEMPHSFIPLFFYEKSFKTVFCVYVLDKSAERREKYITGLC